MFRFPRTKLVHLLLLALTAAGALPLPARAQSADSSFDPNLSGNVYAMARQPDGKLLVAGGFISANPNQVGTAWDRGRMARFHPDGSLDPTFWAEFNNDVTSVLLQPDGRIIVAGKFTTVRSLVDPGTPIARHGLARLMSDGRLDLSYDPNPQGLSSQALVRAMVRLADGGILVGGDFSGFQPNGAGATLQRKRLARIKADGTLDPDFTLGANNVVLALARDATGRILVGGGFTSLEPPGGSAPVPVARLARLNPDGSLDASFAVAPDNRVLALQFEADGSLLVAGDFLRVSIDGVSTTTPHLFRLRADGALDEAFDVIPNGPVNALAIQANGRILLGGSFSAFFSRLEKSTLARTNLARLFPDGSLDASLAAFPTAPVYSILVEPDGSIVLGGAFTRIQGSGSSTSLSRRRMARLQPNGALDSAFSLNAGGAINAIVRLSDGGTIYGGTFSALGGVTRPVLARVGAAGEIDLDYAPQINGTVSALALQSDGKLVVGGNFIRVNGQPRQYIARLNADGTLDTGFDPKANSVVSKIVLQADGKILVGGSFTSFAPNGATESTIRNFIARLNADGTLDSFNPSAGSLVNAIVVQGDGKILIGGLFTSLRPNATGNSIGRSYLARLNADGTLDTAFNFSLNSSVSAIALQSDGKILIGGLFTAVAASGATEATSRNFIARLNPDATLDTGFDPNPNSSVTDIKVLPNGNIVIAGAFAAIDPNKSGTALIRRQFAWLNADGTSPEERAFSFNASISALAVVPDALLVAGSFDRVLVPPDAVGVAAEAQVVRFTSEGVLDSGFSVATAPPTGGYVGAIATQDDGRVLLGGSFDGILGSENRNLVRVGPDGPPDLGFFAKPDGPVNAVLVAPASDAGGSEAVGGPVGWLDADGGLLASFNPADSSSLSGSVVAIARQDDGKLLVGGDIGNSFGVGSYLVRFNADGSIDSSFAPNPNDEVRAIAVQGDGKIVIGGTFTTIAGTARNYIARLNADGSLDTTFDPNANSSVSALRILSDGRILVGGAFTTFTPNGATSATSRAYLARLNAAGTVDGTFSPTPNSSVGVITLQSDGKLMIAGNFSAIGGTGQPFIARLNADGSLDTSFTGRTNGSVSDVAVLGDGRILIGGTFTTVQNSADVDPVQHPYLARLSASGALEAEFDPAPSSPVGSIEVLSDGRILVGGSFFYFLPDVDADPIFRSGLARLLSDGSVDPTFNPIPDGSILTIQVFSDGTFAVGGSHTLLFPDAALLVGGEFENFSEAPVPYLARLFSNGLVDVSFPAQPDAPVFALAAQPDRAIVVGGAFTSIAGTERLRLARMSFAGELDAAFNPGANGTVRTAVVLPDGRIAVGGEFTAIGGAARGRLAILSAAGAVDGAFNANLDGPVNALLAQADGKLVVAGEFTTVNGTPRSHLARVNTDGSLDASYNPAPNARVSALALQGDGRMLVGGAFSTIAGTARAGLARLNRDGSVDASYAADGNGEVRALALQYNGAMVVGGGFTRIAGTARQYVARLSSTSLSSQVISVATGLNSATLAVGGASGDFSSLKFLFSGDAETWTDLGPGLRTGQPGEWAVTGLSLPAASTYYLRVDGLVATTRFGSGNRRSVEAQFFGSTPSVSFNFGASSASGAEGGSGSSDSPSTGGSGSGETEAGAGGSGSEGTGSGTGSSWPGGGTAGPATSGLVNLSGRGFPVSGEPLITGFVITGSETRDVLMRGIGPGLREFGVDDVLEAPVLRIRDGSGALMLETAAWSGSPSVANASDAVGAFPLDPVAADAAVVLNLAPGAYTAQVQDGEGLGGVVLGEVYLIPRAGSEGVLANVSVRGPVGAGDFVLVAGFVVQREGPETVLVRGIGPGLAAFGVSDATTNPYLRVFDAAGTLVAENDDWAAQTIGSVSAVAAAASATQAFSLPAGSRDAALLLTLPAGVYTIQLSARDLGSALIEVYSVP